MCAFEIINPAWIALVEIVDRIEAQPYHWPIGRTSFQKISYVATREGLPTGFQFKKGSFGPFSEDLKRAEAKLVNSNLMQEERHGGLFQIKVGSQFQQVRKEHQASLMQWEAIIVKTTDLFMRVNTDLAEIIATVLFAADTVAHEQSTKPSETDVMDAVMKWKQRRRPPLNQVEVSSAIRNLGILHWLDVTPSKGLMVSEDDTEYGTGYGTEYGTTYGV